MKIIHISDSHECSRPGSVSAYFDKRIVGFFNYAFRRRFLHDQGQLSKAVGHVLEEKPDVVVCTGDITSTGQPAEFAKALERLEPLYTSAGMLFLYVPGNHDAYVSNGPCRRALEDAFFKLNGERWRLDDLPVKIEKGGVEFYLVNECRPTNIFLSSGYFRAEDGVKLSQWCRSGQGVPRVLVGHFPVRKKNGIMDMRRSLRNQQVVRGLLLSGAIDLSLCGHVHAPFADLDGAGRGEICAGSVTAGGHLAEIEYSAGDDRFLCRLKSVGEGN